MASRVKVTEQYAADNWVAACIIAADPVKYPEGGLMQKWADAILTQAAETSDVEAGPLFAARAGQRRAA